MAAPKSDSRRRSLKQAASRTGMPEAAGGTLTSATSAEAQRMPRYTAGGDAGAPPVSLRGGARREEGGGAAGRERAGRAPATGGQSSTTANSNSARGAAEAARRPEETASPTGEAATPTASARGYASEAGNGSRGDEAAREGERGAQSFASTSPTDLRERAGASSGGEDLSRGEFRRSVEIAPVSQGEAAEGTPVAGAAAVEPAKPPMSQPGAAESADASLKAAASFDPAAVQLPADALQSRPGEEVASAEEVGAVALDAGAGEAVSAEAVEGAVEEVSGDEGGEGGDASAEGGEGAAGEGGGGGDGGDDASAGIGKEESVARAAEAVGRLADAYSTVGALRGTSVSFAPHRDEGDKDRSSSQAARQQRQAAEALANDFLAANAGKVAAILAVAEAVPGRLLAAAEAARAAVDAAVEENRAMLAAQIAAVRAGMQADAEAARAEVTASHASAVAAIQSATTAARERVTAAHTSALTTLDTREAAQVARIHELYSEGDTKFRAAGPAAGDAAVARAAERKTTYLSQRNGESDILDGPLHDNRLEASGDAAMQVGEGYKKSLTEEANKQADESQKGKQKDLDNVATQATTARTTLESQLTAAEDALAQAESQALAGADETLAGMTQGIDSGLTSALASLGQQESSQLEALLQFGARQKEAIDRDASTAVASLVESVNAAAETLNQALQSFVTTARASQPPNAIMLRRFLSEAESNVDALAAQLLEQLEQGTVSSEQGVAAGGDTSVDSINTLGQSGVEQALSGGADFTAGMSSLTQQAVQTFSSLQEGHAQTADQSATTTEQGFTLVTEGIQTLFDQLNTGLESGFRQAATEFEKGLRNYVKENLDAAITEKADEAAAQVQPRWKSALKILLVIVVVIVVALVVGPAVIGFVGGLAASAVGAGTAATVIGTVVGGAIVGAASGAVIQLGNNVIDGKENLLEGVGKAAIVGAISGAVGGIGGAWAGTLGNTMGTVGQTLLRGGASMIFDVGGGVLGDLAVGNPITLEGVLIGAAIGVGVSAAAGGLSKIGRIGSIQQGAMAAGERAGLAAGSSVKGAVGIHVDAPSVGGAAAPEVSVKTEPEVTTTKPGTPEAGDVAPTKTATPEAEVTPTRTDTPEPDAPPPAKADAPEPETTPPHPEGTPASEPQPQRATHEGEPQVDEGVVAKQTGPDGHENRIGPDGRSSRCTDCASVRTEYKTELNENPKLQERLNQIESIQDPQVKAQECAKLQGELQQARTAREGGTPQETAGPQTTPKDETGATPPKQDVADGENLPGRGGDVEEPALPKEAGPEGGTKPTEPEAPAKPTEPEAGPKPPEPEGGGPKPTEPEGGPKPPSAEPEGGPKPPAAEPEGGPKPPDAEAEGTPKPPEAPAPVEPNKKVKYVKENAKMSAEAEKYQADVPGAKQGEAPALDYTNAQGQQKTLRLDGVEGDVGIDRKLAVLHTKKAQKQAVRQSKAFADNGMTGRWEVPTEAEARRARQLFAKAGVTNIDVKVVPK
jgi:hypothetical protein